MIQAGSVLMGKYPPGSGKNRRIIVITHPEKDSKGRIAGVFLTSILADMTVILEVGCHPAITSESSVVFEEAFIADSEIIYKGIENGLLRLHEELLKIEFLEQILEGVFESAPRKIERFCTENS